MKAIDDALMTKLGAVSGVTGGVHNTLRPQTGSSWPVIVFSVLGGEDTEAFDGSGPEFVDYDVKVIAPASEQTGVGAIVDAVNTALHRQALTVSGHVHMQTMRVRRLPTYPENSDGTVYIHRGATYRVWVTPSA